MGSREHLQRAIDLAADADRLLAGAGPSWPERSDVYEQVRALSSLGRLHIDIHRELWMEEGDPLIHTGPALGVAAPVLNLPMRPDTRTAAPETPETAADTRTSHPYERNE